MYLLFSPKFCSPSKLEKLLPNRLSMMLLNLTYNNSIIPTILAIAIVASNLKKREEVEGWGGVVDESGGERTEREQEENENQIL
jgi:hypothetical protein